MYKGAEGGPPVKGPCKQHYTLPMQEATCDTSNTRVSFLCGAFSGIVQKLVDHPFDTLKTRMQAEHGRFNGRGALIQCFRDTCFSGSRRKGPIRELYRGLPSPLILQSIKGAVYFSVLNAACMHMSGEAPQKAPIQVVSVAGALIGTLCASFITPFEFIKCRMQSPPSSGYYKSSLDCVYRIVQVEGLKSIYTGYAATVARDMPAMAVYFSIYEYIKRTMGKNTSSEASNIFNILSSGAVAGIAAWVIAYPADVIKSRQQVGVPGSMMTIASQIFKQEGYGAFYSGLAVTMPRAILGTAAQFITFEATQNVIYKDFGYQ